VKFRDRLIRAEFWADSYFFRLSAIQKLFFIGLWGLAEDSGCLEDDPFIFKHQLFGSPADKKITEEVLDGWKNELIQAGKLIPYQVGERKFLFIKNFHKYQQIKNSSAPTLPVPVWVIFTPFNSNPRQGSYEVQEILATTEVSQRQLIVSNPSLTNALQTSTKLNQIKLSQIKLKEAPQIPEEFSELVPSLDKLKGLPSNSRLDPAKILNYLKGLTEEKPEIKRLDLKTEFSKIYAWLLDNPKRSFNNSFLHNWLIRASENTQGKEAQPNNEQAKPFCQTNIIN